ncbi:hypothetical protein SAMN05216464_1063 [Mucilaginibacter pineti]|uniref:CarboxypepD_reg-like domain-containing protein n=1 Tax=Mucilaginibacter pineti TaxID=1391627 RepID=A0A1G7CL75_9SPHI|nr:hypothetical protein SAMN05216464_1063 [Mucilaginibacter pineti]
MIIGLNTLFGQEPIHIYGDIKSGIYQPIEGVTIKTIKGLSSTVSDDKGRFETILLFTTDTLLITKAGYKPTKIVITQKTINVLHIKLKQI